MGTTLHNHLPCFIEHKNPPVDSFNPLTADDGWHREIDGCILYKKILSGQFQLAHTKINYVTLLLTGVIFSSAQPAKFIHVCSILRLSS